MKGDTPAAPDYTGAAKATAAGNLQSAQQATQANRPNMYTPYGSSTWTNTPSFDQSGYDSAMAAYNQSQRQSQGTSPGGSWQTEGTGGDNGSNSVWVPNSSAGSSGQPAMAMPNRSNFTGGDNWTNNVTLSPSQQALFDQQNQLQTGLFGAQDQALGRVNSTMSQPFDASSLPAAGTAYDPTQATNTATADILSRVNPQLDRQEAALRTQLANQGISQGSQAWNTAMTQLGQDKNDAFTQASLQGINLGMQQQGQTYGQQTNNRQQALTLASYLRSLPLNELNSLRTGNQVSSPTFPGFSQQATTAGPDYTGAAQSSYNAALANSNAQNASSANTMGGLFSLGSAALLGPASGGLFGAGSGNLTGSSLAGSTWGPSYSIPSDRRLKTNIRAVGKADNGLTIYSYRYKWGGPTMLGYMAQDVQRVQPKAVGRLFGYLTVDYSKVH